MSVRVLKKEFGKMLRGRDYAASLRRFSEGVAESLDASGLDQGNPLEELVSKFGGVVGSDLVESIRDIGGNFSDYVFVPRDSSRKVTLIADDVGSVEALPCEQVFFNPVIVDSPVRCGIGLDELVDGERFRSMELGMRQYRDLNDYWLEYSSDRSRLGRGVDLKRSQLRVRFYE